MIFNTWNFCLNTGIKAEVDGNYEFTIPHVLAAIDRWNFNPVLCKQLLSLTSWLPCYVNATNSFGDMLKLTLESW